MAEPLSQLTLPLEFRARLQTQAGCLSFFSASLLPLGHIQIVQYGTEGFCHRAPAPPPPYMRAFLPVLLSSLQSQYTLPCPVLHVEIAHHSFCVSYFLLIFLIDCLFPYWISGAQRGTSHISWSTACHQWSSVV